MAALALAGEEPESPCWSGRPFYFRGIAEGGRNDVRKRNSSEGSGPGAIRAADRGARMKRGGPRHPKTCDLAERLGIRRAHAVGHLELLFHFAAEFAPEGDVGRFSDKRIAAALDWGGAPGKLVSALVDSGWLDPHPTARLVVHDWGEHADHATLQKLSRAGKKPIQMNHTDALKVCDQPETAGINLIALPEPEPEPEPLPVPVPVPVPGVRQIRSPERKRTSGDASEKAPMRSRLSGFGQSGSKDLPVNWTELEVSNLQ